MSAGSLVVLAAVGVAVTLEAAAAPARTTSSPCIAGRPLRRVALVSSLSLLASCVLASLTASSMAWSLAGASLVVAGGWLRAAAMRNLGHQFRTEAGAEVLVTHGIHRSLRHPSELGVLAWSLGLLFAAPLSVFTVILAVVQLPLLAIRIVTEEAVLVRCFGARWQRYASRTPRFVPTPKWRTR